MKLATRTRNGRSLSKLVLGCLGLLLLAACSQTPAPPVAEEISAEGVVAKDRFKGEGANAYLVEETECSYTEVYVFVAERMVSVDKERSKGTFADVSFFSYDWCEDSYRSGGGTTELNSGEFQIDKKLESATLSATFEDLEGGRFPLTVDVTWSAAGPLRRVKESEQFKEPGYKFTYRLNGSFRDATVSGTFSLPGDSFTLSGSGQLFDAKEGSLYILQENKLPPVIESFSADPYVIGPGECSTLSWSVSGDKRTILTIDQGIGNVTGQSSVVVCPEETTTYTLTATNRNGGTSQEVTVYVAEPDVLEPNNLPSEATEIALDFTSPQLNITPTDVDWFSFTLTESSQVVADIDASSLGSSLDSVLGLFDADLNEIATNDDFENLDSHLEVEVSPGTYYLAVSGYSDFSFVGNHGQFGFYYLTVTATP